MPTALADQEMTFAAVCHAGPCSHLAAAELLHLRMPSRLSLAEWKQHLVCCRCTRVVRQSYVLEQHLRQVINNLV